MTEPPAALRRQLWPWIEEWEPRFEARTRRRQWAQGGLDEDDLAGDGFLELLRRLRVVLLQDLAVLQPRFPSLPFFAHAPFCGEEWEAFAYTVQASVANTMEPQSLLSQRALLELSSLVESTRNAILHNSQQLAGHLAGQLASQFASQLTSQLTSQERKILGILLSGKVPAKTTGYLEGEGGGVPGASTSLSLTPGVPGLAPVPELEPPADQPTGAVPPVVARLAKIFTVEDA